MVILFMQRIKIIKQIMSLLPAVLLLVNYQV